jgi:hypothetical protein
MATENLEYTFEDGRLSAVGLDLPRIPLVWFGNGDEFCCCGV